MIKTLFYRAILFYQKKSYPRSRGRCKFYPTCSNYALAAINRFGAFKGTLLAIFRLLRCNEFSKGGIDLVPEKKVR